MQQNDELYFINNMADQGVSSSNMFTTVNDSPSITPATVNSNYMPITSSFNTTSPTTTITNITPDLLNLLDKNIDNVIVCDMNINESEHLKRNLDEINLNETIKSNESMHQIVNKDVEKIIFNEPVVAEKPPIEQHKVIFVFLKLINWKV